MSKTRLDVYVDTENLLYLDRLKEEWKRNNYSQTINLMISNYVSLVNKFIKTMNIERPTKEKENPIDKLNKKYGIGEQYGNDR